MIQLLGLLCDALIGLLRSRARREAEILVLRHQINVLRRKSPNRPALSNVDRLLFVLLSQLVPSTLDALTVIKPATVIRWFPAAWSVTTIAFMAIVSSVICLFGGNVAALLDYLGNISARKVSNLSSRMGSSVLSRSCPPRTPRGAWPASSCWHWR